MFSKLCNLFQYLAASVYDFLDVFIVNGINVHGTNFFLIGVSICQRTFNYSLHSNRVGIDADKVVFNEDIIIEGFVMHFS